MASSMSQRSTASQTTKDASNVIGQCQEQEQSRPSLWKVWLLAARPHTLTASLSPCIVGFAIASTATTADSALSILPIFLTWFSFCVLIQLATNLHNDYADFIKGAC